jgi:hypothetical protein
VRVQLIIKHHCLFLASCNTVTEKRVDCCRAGSDLCPESKLEATRSSQKPILACIAFISNVENMAECTIEEFLIDSARYGDTEDVEMALKEGGKVDSTDEGGRTGARRLC